ncbi:MAG: alpha/beta hydrolase [Caulobacteraceae bacterium]
MRRPVHLLLSVFILALSAPPCLAGGDNAAVNTSAPALATLGSTRQIEFQSQINGERYRVQILVPHHPPPTAGYPSLYILDGDALFGTFAEAVRNRALAGEIAPAVVVGISGASGPRSADRTYDFTSTDMTPREKRVIKDLGPNPPHGGADSFLRVIDSEIRPRVAQLVLLDKRKAALFGWSLGGLFVVHTLLSHPEDFQTYVALSPSLWRDERAVFQDIPSFKTRLAKDRPSPRLFLGVGSREEEATPGLGGDAMTRDELVAELRYCRMVGNADDLGRELRSAFASGTLDFRQRVFPGETHNSVPWAAVNPVLDFALPTGVADPADRRTSP